LTIHNADYESVLYRNDKVKLIYKVLSKFFLKILTMTRVVIFVHGEAMQKALATQLQIPIERISIYKVPSMATQSASVSQSRLRKPVRLLFCGVVRHDKGYDLLCEALSVCRPKTAWQLRIAGSVRQVGEDYVRSFPKKWGIFENCSFNLKYLTSEEIDAEFLACDLVVLPYRRGFIAQSVVMTDAMRWNKPVIVSEHSQNGYDALKHNVGWVFISEDIDSLSAALDSAITSCLNNRAKVFGFADFMLDHSPKSVGQKIISATA
jgi:glycosyltransferase involved in cell wall biosynthesis